MKLLGILILLFTSNVFANKQFNKLNQEFNKAPSVEAENIQDTQRRIIDLLFDVDLFFMEGTSELAEGNKRCDTYRKKEGIEYCKQDFMVKTMGKVCKIKLQDIRALKIDPKANGAKQTAQVITYHQSGYIQECR